MNTLPKMLARGMMALGLINAPADAVRAAIPLNGNGNGKRRLVTTVRDGKAADYDPDDDFTGPGFSTPKYTPFDMSFGKSPDGEEIGAVNATLYEVSADGKSYTLRRYTEPSALIEAVSRAQRWNSETINNILPPSRLLEATQAARDKRIDTVVNSIYRDAHKLMREGLSLDEVRERLREADDFAVGESQYGMGQSWVTGSAANYGNGRDPYEEYIPLMGGPWAKQLYLYQYLDMHRKAFEAFNHNPWAHQLVMLTTYFTLGRGIDHTCNNVELDESLREFTDRTEFYARFENMMTDTWWSGNMFIEWFDDDPFKGATDFRTQDPSTIWDIITDPEDIRKVYYYHQQYSTPMQTYIPPGAPKNVTSTSYVIRQIPADQMYHEKINVSEWEKYGRSDLFPILGWAKRLKDLMNAHVIRGILEGAFCWDITISSGETDVDAMGLQLPDPFSPGSTFVHTSAVKLEAKQSGMSGADITPIVDALSNTLAVGTGQPKEFIGQSSRGARAGVLTAVEPGTKRYESRQQLEMRIAHNIFDHVINNLAKAGVIDLDEVLRDARTVKRLATTENELPNRDDVKEEVETAQEEAQEQAEEQAEQQNQLALKSQDQQHELALNDQKFQHRQNLAAIKSGPKVIHRIDEKRTSSMREGGSLVAQNPNIKGNEPLNDKQKQRIAAIKKSGKYSRELIEFSFPSIAQEDRSAKLKDLALAEAMEWLPKSITATMAAKELGISTYEFYEMWTIIVQEAKQGMSIAHVYGQDNKHVPDTALAQSVQEELQAKVPPAASPTTVQPQLPAPAGFKDIPNKNAPTPGAQPNSGDTKVNQHASPGQPDATAPSNGYSNAAKNPMTAEGAAKIRKAESDVMRRAIYTVLLREAIQPLITMRTGLARYILEQPTAKEQFEESVAETEKGRIRDDNN